MRRRDCNAGFGFAVSEIKADPVIIQDAGDGAVLMLGFTNREAVERTLQTKNGMVLVPFPAELWNRGEQWALSACGENACRL